MIAWVAANIVEEFSQRALEAQALAHPVHFALDPRHFAKAKLMDGFGIELDRGLAFDRPEIEPGAALHRRNPDRLARRGEVFVVEEAAQPAVNGVDLVADNAEVEPLQFVAPFGRNRIREIPHGRGKGRFLHWLGQDRIDLGDHVASGQPGFDHTAVDPLAEADNRVVEDLGEDPHEFEVAAIFRLTGIAQRAAFRDQRRQFDMHTPEMGEGPHHDQREHVGLQPHRGFALVAQEDVIRNLPLGAELGAVDPAQRGQHPFDQHPPATQRRIGEGLAQRHQVGLAAAIDQSPGIERILAPGNFAEQRHQSAVFARLGGDHAGGAGCPGRHHSQPGTRRQARGKLPPGQFEVHSITPICACGTTWSARISRL